MLPQSLAAAELSSRKSDRCEDKVQIFQQQKTGQKSEGQNAVLAVNAFSFSLQAGYGFQNKKRETR